jgi:hypothetical protein
VVAVPSDDVFERANASDFAIGVSRSLLHIRISGRLNRLPGMRAKRLRGRLYRASVRLERWKGRAVLFAHVLHTTTGVLEFASRACGDPASAYEDRNGAGSL